MTLSKNLTYLAVLVAAFAAAGVAYADDGKAEKHGLFGRVSDEVTVSIGGGGNVLVRGATVTAVDGDDITATTKWSGATLTWDVDTDADTNYVDASGEASSRADIEVGDNVSFSGMLEGALSVAANIVRDWSEGDAHDREHLAGTVKSVGTGSFVIETGSRRVTVDIDTDTDFTIGKEEGEFSDLETGMRVRVAGEYDGDEFNASSVVEVAATSKKGEKDNEHRFKPWLDFFHGLKLNWH